MSEKLCRVGVACLVILILLAVKGLPVEGSQSVRIAWDASVDSDVVAYFVYYGERDSLATSRIAVGDSTTAVIDGLETGKIYFIYSTALNAAGHESVPSETLFPTNSRCLRWWCYC